MLFNKGKYLKVSLNKTLISLFEFIMSSITEDNLLSKFVNLLINSVSNNEK